MGFKKKLKNLHKAKGSAHGKCSNMCGYGLFLLGSCLLPSLSNIDRQVGVYALCGLNLLTMIGGEVKIRRI